MPPYTKTSTKTGNGLFWWRFLYVRRDKFFQKQPEGFSP